MLVELFGIPGSGKSTLVKAASEHAAFRTRHDVSAAWDRGSIIGRAAQLVGRYADPQEMALAVRLAAAARIRDRCGLARLLRIAGKAQRLKSQPELVILDQGLLQELWSILYGANCYAPDVGLISKLIGKLYKGIDARIFFIDVDPEPASARIAGRADGHSRLDGLGSDRIRQDLARAVELPTRIIEAARRAGVEVRRIDGSLPIETLVKEIVIAAGR